MNSKASPASTNPSKKCRALVPYFPSLKGRLAGEHTVLETPPDVYSRFHDPPECSMIFQEFIVRSRKRELFLTVCRTFQNATYATYGRHYRGRPGTLPQPISPLQFLFVNFIVFMKLYLTSIGKNLVAFGGESCSSCREVGSDSCFQIYQ
jgi:hypothetical protein